MILEITDASEAKTNHAASAVLKTNAMNPYGIKALCRLATKS